MRIITLNVNGIRAAAQKGFFHWLSQQQADVVCLQEVRAQQQQLMTELFYPQGYYCYYHDAVKKGYSGVALYSRWQPQIVFLGLGWSWLDQEARYLEARFAQLSIVSLYLPSGTSGDERQAFKMELLQKLMPYLKTLHQQRREYILCGDWNIAHQPIDLKNWRSNQKHSGFLPEERAWLDELLGPMGFVDAFRVVNQAAEQYTWWSHRGRAWDNNTGWRIDYQITTPGLKATIQQAQIYKQTRFSDHAPLIIDYRLAP